MGEKIVDGFPSREDALADFFAAWEPSDAATATELVSLDEAVGRITARDLASANTLPVVRASSCDGIAVKSAAFAHGRPDPDAFTGGPGRCKPGCLARNERPQDRKEPTTWLSTRLALPNKFDLFPSSGHFCRRCIVLMLGGDIPHVIKT